MTHINKFKDYLVANDNIVKRIEALSSVGHRGSVHMAICLYASVCDFEYRNIFCDFSLNKLKKIQKYLKETGISLSLSKNYSIFEEYVVSDEILNRLKPISLFAFIELSILNLDYITKNNYIVRYITTGSEESELFGTREEQIMQIVNYWSSKVDQSMLSVDFSEAHERCWACGLKRKLQFYHIIPDSLGGEKVPSNLVLMCKHCHRLAPSVDNKDAGGII